VFASDGAPAPVTEPSEPPEVAPWPKPALGTVRRSGSMRPHRRRPGPSNPAKRGDRGSPSSRAGGRSRLRSDPVASPAPSPPVPDSATTPPITASPAPVPPPTPPPPAHPSEPREAAPRPVPPGAPSEFM
jgi:hypothetical protein